MVRRVDLAEIESTWQKYYNKEIEVQDNFESVVLNSKALNQG